jgi:chromosome segregation ATPase
VGSVPEIEDFGGAWDARPLAVHPKSSNWKNLLSSIAETDTMKFMNAVIKPWLVAVLIGALLGNVLLSAFLIIKLGRFDEAKQAAEVAESQLATKHAELASLKVEADNLNQQVVTLKPAVADWQKKLEEKSQAEAFLKSVQASQIQVEADITNAANQLDAVKLKVAGYDKEKIDALANIEVLRSEQAALNRTNINLKSLIDTAADAEQRYNVATNNLANAVAKQRAAESDYTSAQTQYVQIQKEAEDLRKNRSALSSELATLRQELQTTKDQIGAMDKLAAEVKAKQDAAQQEDQKLKSAREIISTVQDRLKDLAEQNAQLTNQISVSQSLANDWESKRVANQVAAKQSDTDLNKIRADLQTAQEELVGVRKLSKELTAKQDEQTREIAAQESQIKKLNAEKESLEKALGNLDAHQSTPATGSNK